MARKLLVPVTGFQDKGGQLFNVKAYGAKGDGTTDDGAAINAAITAASAAGGGDVLVPPSANPYLSGVQIVLASNVNLVGSGYRSVIKQKNSVDVNRFIYGSAISNVTIDNLVVDYNHANNTSVGEGMGIGDVSSYITVQNCTFLNAKGFAISLFGQPAVRNHHCRVLNNAILNPVSTPNDMLLVVSDYGIVAGNYVKGSTHNISIVPFESDYMLVAGNVVELGAGSNGQSGISCLSLRYSTISNNKVIGAGNGVAYSIITEHDNASPVLSEHNLLQGNTARNVDVGLQLLQTTNDVLYENIVDTAIYGLEFPISASYAQATSIYVRNNKFTNVSGAAINNPGGAIRVWYKNNVGIENHTSIVTSGSSYAVNRSTDNVIVVNKTTGSATTINLADGTEVEPGKRVVVKDGKGDAATNKITLDGAASQTIDGALTYVISANYGSAEIIWNGTEWNVIASSKETMLDYATNFLLGGL